VRAAASTLGDSFTGDYQKIADIEFANTRTDGGWLCLSCSWGAVHIVPVLDGVLHHVAEGDDCICVPEVETFTAPDGSMIFMHTHSSLDGRELHE
jgi:hypothetical protein